MSSLVLPLLLALPSFAQDAAAPGGVPVIAGDSTITTLPAEPRAVLELGDMVWVLTQDQVLQRWSRGPEGWGMGGEQRYPGAVDLASIEGAPWLVLSEVKAVPLLMHPEAVSPLVGSGSGSVSAVQPSPEATPSAPPVAAALGAVLSVGQGAAVVDLGRAAGVGPGTELRFMGTELVEVPSLSGEGVEQREVGRVSGTGRVRLVEDERALVDLDRGSRVRAGDAVELAPEGLRYPIGPERLGGLRESGLVIRPVLGLDTLGVAFINELWTTWHFESPWYATLRAAPLGLGWSRDGNPISVAGLISGGYDARYFSVGLGAGWSMLNGDPGNWGRSYDYAAEDGGWGAVQFEDVDNAFSVVQEARLGAQDGLHLTVRNTFVLVPQQESRWTGECEQDYWYYYYEGETDKTWEDCYELVDEGDSFEYGGIAMALYVPVGSRTDLFTDWGTGGSGVTWVEGGVATWLRGHGDAGSLGISVAAGYGSLQAQPDDDWVELYGPLVSLGARWRW
jgi:hypothetical protein